MALKDWKKVGISSWLKIGKKNSIRGISMNKDKMLIIDKNTSGHYNVILGIGSTGSRVLKSSFKTKKQAIKFVRSYMRKH